MIVDCFMFFNELDLLEIRLDYLSPKVDYFVLVEARFTQLGNPKELFYENNKARYAKYADKIIHVIVDEPVTQEYGSWGNENHQRQAIVEGLNRLSLVPEAVIIVSDLDEIPSIEGIDCFISRGCPSPAGLTVDMYYYYLNWKADYTWDGPMLTTWRTMQQGWSPQVLRNMRNGGHRLPVHGGWHFSYLGGAEAVLTKITSVCESNCHEPYKSTDYLQNMLDQQTIHFNGQKVSQVDITSVPYPSSLIASKDKYAHLFKE